MAMRQKTLARTTALAIILAMFAGLSLTLFRLAAVPFDSDEAIHALDGMQVAVDLYHGDLAALLDHVYFTGWYPPLLPTYLGVVFALVRPAYWSARYAVLLLAVIYAALTYRVAGKLATNVLAGLVALGLAATSPLVWLHGPVCMEEMLALIGMLLTILAFVRAQRGQGRPGWIGLGMAATLLTRISVGLYVIGAVGLLLGLDWLRRGRAGLLFGLRAAAPLAVASLFWWGHPAKLRTLSNYLQASQPDYAALSWPSLSYYWRAIVTSSTVSPIVGVVVLASIVGVLAYRRERIWRLPLAIIATTWGVLLIKRLLDLRFFMSGLTATFLITGLSVTKAHTALTTGGATWIRRTYRVLVLIILISTLPFLVARAISFPLLMEVAYETDVTTTDLFAWIEQRAEPATPVFFVNGWDQLSTLGLNVYLGKEAWPRWHGPQATDVLLVDPAREPDRVEAFYRVLASSPESYVVHLTNSPVPHAGAWWAYRPALETCWSGDWDAVTGVWVRLWDGAFRDQILRHPFRYVDPAARQAAREANGYPLLIEARAAVCRPQP